MNSGLNSPLGADRKPAARRRPFQSLGRAGLFFGLAFVAGLSLYFAMRPETRLQGPEVASVDPAKPVDSATILSADDITGSDPAQPDKLIRSRAHDGANVEKQVMDDGSIVTKFTPKNRDDSGPVIIDASAAKPQDAANAAFPDEALVEETPDGKLPIVSAEGTRPIDRYARPWSGARGTRISIIIGGLGLSQTGTQRALRLLPEEITLAFASSGNSLQRWMQDARRGGHEILLQVPLEPFDYPENDPGPLTLLNGNSEDKNLARLHESMGRITNYTGIMNFLGGRFLADAVAVEPVMRDIGKRGLLFLDDGSSAQSLSGTYAKAFSVPHAFADVVLDNEVSRKAVLVKLDELERIALRKGTAIGVASAFDESVDAVVEWAGEASKRGIEIVGISALADVPQ